MKHDDEAQDKAMMKKLIGKHEGAKHKGQPKTKLSSGGTVIRGTGAATKGIRARGPMA
jgi:hypothetical protein